ncbi:hypothetical protein ABVK25_007738 [Lepraria finkii]|uniref:Uncharacterized protein n=1 Tax=Lepraria finkii TaxID=1340010 RepID=A0ABR4B2A2_9LECA
MQKRFVETVLEYAERALNQVRNREKGQVSWSVEGFIAHRRDTFAVETTFAFIEYCLRIDVPDEAYYNPVMQ